MANPMDEASSASKRMDAVIADVRKEQEGPAIAALRRQVIEFIAELQRLVAQRAGR
jgi:septum formation topological specificity factor MinE